MWQRIGSAVVAGGLALAVASSVWADPVAVAGATASAFQPPNVAGYAIDADEETRWSVKGVGEYLQLELAECGIVGSLQSKWYNGDKRRAFFDIEVSTDGIAWTNILADGESSGMNAGFETVDLPDTEACYVRIVGFGNSHKNPNTALWTSLYEVVVHGPDPTTIDVPLSVLQELCSSLPQPAQQ
jgi:hypothetical protein